jgi:hypothetical protein
VPFLLIGIAVALAAVLVVITAYLTLGRWL